MPREASLTAGGFTATSIEALALIPEEQLYQHYYPKTLARPKEIVEEIRSSLLSLQSIITLAVVHVQQVEQAWKNEAVNFE